MSAAVLDAVEDIADDEMPPRPEVPEGCELVDGEVREVFVSTESSRVSGEIFFALKSYAVQSKRGWVFPEGTQFRCFPDEEKRTRRSNTAFISFERLPPERYEDEGYCTTAPDIAVEVISPNDLAVEVEEKLQDWLDAGAKLVWILEIHSRTVRCHGSDGSIAYLRETDTLTSPGLLPEFACPVVDLFKRPES